MTMLDTDTTFNEFKIVFPDCNVYYVYTMYQTITSVKAYKVYVNMWWYYHEGTCLLTKFKMCWLLREDKVLLVNVDHNGKIYTEQNTCYTIFIVDRCSILNLLIYIMLYFIDTLKLSNNETMLNNDIVQGC